MTDPNTSKPARPAGAPAADPAKAPASGSSSATGNNASWDDDEEEGEAWRHAPVAPKDENVLDSLGRSISEVVTDAGSKGKDKGKPPGRP